MADQNTDKLKIIGDRKLVTGKFFFWNSGTRLQKSLAGLSRALLIDVFQAFPGLVSLAFQSRWKEALDSPWQTGRTLTLTDQECIEALERLIAESSKQSFSHRFCFFIDALDELQETPEFTFRDLSRTLKSWVQASGGNVKFCVSSREYYQFMDELESKSRIRLHEVTKQDMFSFAQQKVHFPDPTYNFRKLDNLVLAIVEKAQGVFLWTVIVTNDVSEKLSDGHCHKDLIKQIDSLPDELESLFMHVIEALPRQDRPGAYKALSLMLEASQWDLPLSVLDFVFLGQYEKDPRPDFFLQHRPSPIYAKKTTDEISVCERRLVRCCRGLVEIVGRCSEFRRVQLSHRSVQEFLMQPEIQARLNISLSVLDTKEALSQIICISQRAYGLNMPSGPRQYNWLRQIMAMREAGQLDREPWVFLNSLEMLFSQESPWFPATSVIRGGKRPFPRTIDPYTSWLRCFYGDMRSPVFWFSHRGYSEFSIWWLRHTPMTDKLKAQAQLLISCAVAHLAPRSHAILAKPGDQMAHICLCMVQTGLERGLIIPDSAMDFIDCGRLDCQFECCEQRGSLTVLETFFLEGLVSHIRGRKNVKWIGDILEALLLHEANLDFTFSFEDADTEYRGHISLRVGQKSIGQHFFYINGYAEKNSRYFSNLSPRDVVKKCNFHNKDRLLELLDGQKNRSNRNVRSKLRLAAPCKPWAPSTICHALFWAFLGKHVVFATLSFQSSSFFANLGLGSSMTVVIQKLCS